MSANSRILNPRWARTGVLGSVIAIPILAVLESPPPIGFETRPQGDVSLFRVALLPAILVTETATILLVFKRPQLGATLAIVAAVLNILQVFGDQLHLMQPRVAPFGYLMLEYSVGLFALALACIACTVHQERTNQ